MLGQAQDLCSRVGEAWKAAALEGWRLYHDPNTSSLGPGGTRQKVTGNPHRDLWKTVCWRLAQEVGTLLGLSLHEKCVVW